MILAALLALSQPAAALDVKWWGVGPTVGTIAVPGKYPVGLPGNAQEADNTDKVQRVGGDIDFGVHAVLYPSANGRLAARGLVGLGLGSPWSSGQLTVEYDYAFVKESGFQMLIGAGLGAGTERFGGTEGKYEDGYLVVNYFPLRAQLSALLRDKTRAYELDLFTAYHVAADQTYYSGPNAEGVTPEGLEGAALYLKVGIEATVYFGDFKTDKSQKGGGRKGRKNKR